MSCNTLDIIEPSEFSELTESERSKRIVQFDHFYIFDQKIVLFKAQLSLEVCNTEEVVFINTWVYSGKDKFQDLNLSGNQSIEDFRMRLFNEIPFYPNSKDLDVTVTFSLNIKSDYPRITSINGDSILLDHLTKGLPLEQKRKLLNQEN